MACARSGQKKGCGLNLNSNKKAFQEGWMGSVIYVGVLLAIIGGCVALILLA
jgi:hypothetical protein